MKICLICEGSYPYVAGGVASWVQMLISASPSVEFAVLSIATSREEMCEYKFKLPNNLKEVRTIYLQENNLAKKHASIRLKKEECEVLSSLVYGEVHDIPWSDCLELFKKHKNKLSGILMGKDFYKIALDLYNRIGLKASFSDYLWNLRGMYAPFMHILSAEFIKADIYHSVSTGYAGIFASVASYVTGKPFLLSEHGIYTREREEDIIRASWLSGDYKQIWIDFFKKISLITYKQASIVTSLFDTNRTLQVELGCDDKKIRIIPNGVDAQLFKNLAPRSAESKGFFNIGAILRMVPIKDIKTMIVGFAIAKKELPNIRLNLLGNYDEDPEYYQECVDLVQEMRVKDVTFFGQVKVREHLQEFDLLLLTSISEGQPLAILEGLAAGIPFICTNVGNCRDLLLGKGDGDGLGRAGYIVPVMDATALAKQIIICEGQPEKLKQMGQIGQQRVEKFYPKQGFLEQFHIIYKELGGKKWQE